MEKKHDFFSAKLNLLFILLIMLFHGHSHGSRIDQAGPLRAVRRARMRAQTQSAPDGDDKWSVSSLGSEGYSFDVGKMEDDLIEGGLPGQPSGVMFNQYAGYVTVDKSKGRSLFYYFAEAVHSPSSSPLILWLNGGPGCSSLGVGAMVEIGPFGVRPDGKTLYLRRHAWNKVANILFLESPAGVGFSYSNTTSDYNISGDIRTAQDTYTFLINWFKRYPHYKARDFYIMGESYSGYYIPELADYIIKKNVQADSSSKIQLTGIMIGNGIMNDVTDVRGMHDYVWSHALISDETYRGLIEHCKNSSSPKCDDFGNRIGREAGQIDFYNIYSPLCLPASSSNSSSWKQLKRYGGRYDPCEEDYVYMYLNLPQVHEALHANTTKLPYHWEFCSNLINSWKDSPSTMFPVYRRLIALGLRILLYSGDVDAVVPVSGTRYSIDALNLKVIEPWHPWSDDNEVAGYRVGYDGLTFTTIRGAGHEVPRFQPRRVLALLKTFIAGK
uniref:Putative serine carboxypeptidase-like 23 n=1 Tax=Davidia involucrata TaxID=16924 RepID=A0A5B7C9Z1_DAVIN